MKLSTSAKINLNLEIFSEKQDNLHKLSSLMIPINIYDFIDIEESLSESIKFSDENLNTIESTIQSIIQSRSQSTIKNTIHGGSRSTIQNTIQRTSHSTIQNTIQSTL